MTESSPARLYAGVVGATLVVVGILGFFYNAGFNADAADRDAVLGLLDVNGWHNVIHIATGLLGLVAFMAGTHASRYYALAMGIVYSLVAVWGFVLGSGESILGIVPINAADNLFHLALALLGLVACQMWVPAVAVATALLFGLAIPALATNDHDSESQIAKGQMLFAEDGCRNCHTLGASGSLGTIGPNLNESKPSEKRVLEAIAKGGLGTGAMPENLASGADAEAIAAYVADATGAAAPVGGPAGKQIFSEQCASCHTLAAAGATGTVGPDLDQLKPSTAQVLKAIKNGGLTGSVMPKNLVTGKQAQQVAAYISSVAGK
ncbi:MAG: DUF4383 domain-containing protein [Solirubrobacterales bacterium]